MKKDKGLYELCQVLANYIFHNKSKNEMTQEIQKISVKRY